MPSSKIVVNQLTQLLQLHGVKHVVISPGSRNAPLILNFSENRHFQCYSIADERSAAFFALGLAINFKETVALCCTSGSAGLNYGPALVEAYYQKIPLIAITADRPEILINQNDGQAMMQRGQYANFINFGINLNDESSLAMLQYNERRINEAILHTKFPVPGPVHINLHLSEPLYDRTSDIGWNTRKISRVNPNYALEFNPEQVEILKQSQKVLILIGQQAPSADFFNAVAQIAEKQWAVILTEVTSNVMIPDAINCIDKAIDGFQLEEKSAMLPDLLITTSGAVVSKKVKAWLREKKLKHHWHVGLERELVDTYGSLTTQFQLPEESFFKSLNRILQGQLHNAYFQHWQKIKNLREQKQKDFLERIPFSDLYVFQKLLQWIPEESAIHLGNSTPVRYAQLFSVAKNFSFYSNRGVSGIDGSLSTAAGVAWQCKKWHLVITGDISFFYDSNALWNNYLGRNLIFVLINNGGGNIFKIIPGPDKHQENLRFFETPHSLNAAGIAQTFNLKYISANDKNTFEKGLCEAFSEDEQKAKIFEINTSASDNAEILKDFLNHFKKI
jgi:2-succinyl-5-enolpyruvyl-6-hydroxy-3-cyclohexene-1-carboxylate synthase